MAISGNGGAIKERRQFDPWGNLKKYSKNNVEVSATTFNNVDFEFLTDRGYTAHEHFFSVGIIHMNARLYDPILHTFLSPDALISDPSNPQNYNRYAYALNNPLMYVDYSGNNPIGIGAAILIGALIGGSTYAVVALYTGTFSWGGLAKSIAVGAISGAVSWGVGEVVSSLSTSIKAAYPLLSATQVKLLVMLPQAAMHGYAQGIIQGVSGGDFGQSFLTAAISSITAGGYGMLGGKTQTAVGQALFGTVAGGVTAELQGGNFWQGAAMGLTVSLLNHVAHEIEEKQTVRGVLKRLGLKGGDKAPKTYASLRLLLSDPAVKSQYIMGGSPTVGDGGQLSIGKADYKVTNGERADATTDIFGNGDIVIYGNSFKDWETLAYNTVHELTHRFQWSMGYINKWSNQFGGRRDVVWNMAEYDARSNIIGWGFDPPAGYVSSHKSYVNYYYPNTIK